MLFWDGKGFELKKHSKTLPSLSPSLSLNLSLPLSSSPHLLWASHSLVPFSNNRMVFDRSRQSMPRFTQNIEVMTSAHFVRLPLCLFEIKMHSIKRQAEMKRLTKECWRVALECQAPPWSNFSKVWRIKPDIFAHNQKSVAGESELHDS